MNRTWVWVVLAMLGLAGSARAQGSRRDDMVFNALGRPMAGATVRVCTSAATGQPCAPLAAVYADAALTQALANPLATDGLGNYSFYASPGRYLVEISGPGITTKQIPGVILPSDPNSPTFPNINNVIYVDGVKYALTAAGIQSAVNDGGKNAHIILPPGTITISVGSQPAQYCGVFVSDGDWISGAGKDATTVKRANSDTSTGNNPIFCVAGGGGFGTTGDVLFSDFTIDGNYLNQTTGSDNINGPKVFGFRVQRMGIINAYSNGIGLFVAASTDISQNLRFSDNYFDSNGLRAGCVGEALCQDIRAGYSSNVVVSNNISNNSQNFVSFASNAGDGRVVVEGNTVYGCLGFGVALGGGAELEGASGAVIQGNTFNCPTQGNGGSVGNIIDIAEWNDVLVDSNVIYTGNASGSGGGIVDDPPAFKVVVSNNRIIGNAAASTNSSQAGIELGAYASTIQGNIISNQGGSGIVLAVKATGPVAGTVNTSGTSVTWVSGSHFLTDGTWPGKNITINSVNYTIASVGSSTALTLTGSAGTQTGVNYLEVNCCAAHDTVVSGNVIYDNNIAGHPLAATEGGIETYIASGGNPAATMKNILITGNRIYDDQGANATQDYGIALARAGQVTGYSNITVVGNDLRGNQTGAILNSLSGATGVLIAENPGGEAQALGPLNASQLSLSGATSGAITHVPPAVAGSNTITDPAATGTYGVSPNLLISPTAPTISSGFGTSPSVTANNGTASFRINVGTGGTASSGVIGLPAAANGWNCYPTDITTTSSSVFMTKQTASTTTTATLGNFNTSGAATAWAASDILAVSCFAF